MPRSSWIAAVSAGLVVAVTAGCSNPFKSKTDADHPAAIAVVLVDVSKSTYGQGGAQRSQYRRSFERILSRLPGGTLLKADVIDDNPLAHTTFPVTEYFEKSDFVNNTTAQVKQQRDRAAARALDGWDAIARRRPTGNAILDSLGLAQKVFDSYPDAKTRYLVIFSDMFENSKRYSFEQKNLSPDRVERFIERERSDGRLPDLMAVEVYVIGAGATRGADASPQHIRTVELFWVAYLRASGAVLPLARYSPTLIRFP